MLTVAAADPTKLTRFDVALPFLVAAALVLVGAVLEDFVTDKVESVMNGWAKNEGQNLNSVTTSFTPASIGKMSGWTIDTAQVVTTVLAPLVGLAIVWKQGATGALVLANVLSLFFAFVAFRHFWTHPPDKYGDGWPWFFTPLTVLALVLNVVGAGVAYAIGP